MRELVGSDAGADPFACQLAVICLCGGCDAGADSFACQLAVICLCGGCDAGADLCL